MVVCQQNVSNLDEAATKAFLYIPSKFGNLADEIVVFSVGSGLGIKVDEIDIMPERNGLAFLGILGVDTIFQGVFLPGCVEVDTIFGTKGVSSLNDPYGAVIFDWN